jgi:peptide/nickel transport system permease protein
MENIILPAVVLGIRPLAVVIQLMRNSLLETFGQDYIRTAEQRI